MIALSSSGEFSNLDVRWVHTGDEVIIDKDAELFVVDRLKVWPSPRVNIPMTNNHEQEIMKVR